MTIKDDDVAVIGMSCRFPGADSVSRFWDNLCAGRESIRSLSDEQLRAAAVCEADIGADTYVKVSAMLDDVDRFDPGFFKISPLEAELMDPQLRLLLQCGWETLEDAGYASNEPQNIGVFAGSGGVTSSYFSHFVNVNRRFEKITASATQLGNDKDFLSTYLSYKLNLTGPSVTVQTACSTSMVALHQARRSLLNGECDMALAGGVSVRVPHGHGYHSKEGFIFSRSGRMRAFDERADGVVFGSGLGLVLIKHLQEAVADGDHIYAVVKGSAISNDGRGKMSYAASSARGQIACVSNALKNAGVDAGSIGFVEAHGTGTAMGDPEEVKALSAAFKEHTDRKGYCNLGAVKTNVGHLDVASGIVSFIKAALVVKTGLLPPTLHYAKPNPRIRFENTPFHINTSLQPWSENAGPRRAAINSLGMGGTNAFVILEEYVPQARAETDATSAPVIVPISAGSQDSLRGYARKLLDFLAGESGSNEAIRLDDLGYTLQTGRKPMECRVAFVVATLGELRDALARYLQTGEPGDTSPGKEAMFAAQWVADADVNWDELYSVTKPRRISLPTYAFAKERYWIESDGPVATRAVIHPLLHVNTSDLNEQRYTSTFCGDEFFLEDHQVRTRTTGTSTSTSLLKILPGVAYLEMARAAITQAAPRNEGVLELRDIVWVQPLVVSKAEQVSIALMAKHSRIDFEVYGEGERIHCQGQAHFIADVPRPRIDVSRLREKMLEGEHRAAEVYAAFDTMGLHYGPAHRTIEIIHRGETQRLAKLTLPASLQASRRDFVLHPGLMDGALQAAAGLLWNCAQVPGHPFVPFALERLRILAECPAELFVWARRANEKLDVDVCDSQGNVCVEMYGLDFRAIGKEPFGHLLATEVWESSATSCTHTADIEQHIMLCDLPQLDSEKFGRHCTHSPLPKHESVAKRYTSLALSAFEKVQALIQSKPDSELRFQLVIPSGDDNEIYAGLAGMLKTAHLENPLVSGQIIFVPARTPADALASMLAAECKQAQDTLVRYEDGVRRTPAWRLIEGDPEASFGIHGAFKDQGVYLITGGLGGLGTIFAREILEHAPTARIILTGRLTLAEVKQSPARAAVLDSLQAAGRAVEYRQLRLDDLHDVELSIEAIRAEYKQLNGVIHSAGATRDSFILKKTAEELREVFAPKVDGTVHLDLATQHLDLDFLVLFSALGTAVGNLGQADYVAANGFMDRFASVRNRWVAKGQRRGHTLAIRWPLWRDGGMQVDEAGRMMLQERTGSVPLQTATGRRLFYRSLASGCDQTLAMAGELHKLQQVLRIGVVSNADQVASQTTLAMGAPVAAGSLAGLTEEYLRKQFCTLLKLPIEKVDVRTSLENYGIDSILALDFTRRLEQTFGVLSKTLLFEYLTLSELAGYFVKAHASRLSSLFAAADSAQGGEPTIVEPRTPAGSVPSVRFGRGLATAVAEPIAIVGLSGRYPQARNVGEFWRNLRDGKDCIVEVPPERWDWREYYSEDRTQPGHHFSKWGGFIEGVDEFDARFFSISAVEAQSIDPQERLFLQHAWMSVEDAGYTRASLQTPAGTSELPGQVGVYAGAMYGEYQLFGVEASLQGQRSAFASNLASIANRASYVLNLHGPSMVVDTMCSSSLTAIHLACQDLKLGRTSVAIAGGVNITIHPNKYLMLSAGQFISGDGHCQSFGAGGDGYIPGEGVGVVVLKRLSDAQRDGNHIYGVIRGSALSHGGKTNGYTVPNPQAQASAIRQAFAQAGVDPRHVSYVEAHGTGTKLGDPIEIAGLGKAFQESTADTQFCLIGSAKSNIGHCEAAAGIAGLTKVLLQMKHQQIVPSLHASRLNPHIDFASSPFMVSQRLQAWEQPVLDGRALPRIAGISSFGAGGSNAHLVIEEYVPGQVAQESQVDAPCIIPLSARTAEQLRLKARDLLDFLRADAASASLRCIAYTLQVGREAMDERLALLANSVEQLRDKLQSYLDGRADIEGVYAGQVKANKEALSLLTREADLHTTFDKWIAAGKLATLADFWAKGLEIDWSKFHATRPRLVSLPTYPFARQRHWVETTPCVKRATKVVSRDVIHPLLHINTSDFARQSYTATFDGAEFFLVGASGERHLAPAAYLEMARVAVEKSMPALDSARTLELRHVAWAQPAMSVEHRTLTIALFVASDDQVKFEVFTDDMTLCQGAAWYSDRPAPARLDLNALRQRGDHFVTELRLPAELEDGRGDYVLHPALLTGALEAAGLPHPLDAASVRIVLPVGKVVLACVRSLPGAVDIDLCDEQGNVCLQMLGVRAEIAAVADIPVQEPKRIALDAERLLSLEHRALKKPDSSISLAAPGELDADRSSLRKARVSLSTGEAAIQGERLETAAVCMLDHGNGIVEIRIAAPSTRNALSPALVDELLQALRTAQQQSSLKVLLLGGTEQHFLTGGRAEHEAALELKLYEAIAAFPYPVIAILRAETTGPGFVVGSLCDFMVLSESTRCSHADLSIKQRQSLQGLFEERFGRTLAEAFLDRTAAATGAALKNEGWTCPILPQHQVEAHARSLAADLAKKSQLALRLLKEHLARHLLTAVQALTDSGMSPDFTRIDRLQRDGLSISGDLSGHAERLSAIEKLPIERVRGEVTYACPASVPMRSNVITATAYPEGILVVEMADRSAKNMFSEAFTRGMHEVFAHIEQHPDCKVVLLTGYDNYFSSGGTQETLLAIHQGKVRFTDNTVFQLPLNCPVPVIAAMQGHGIGAGWALGMFADFSLFSEESRYFSPYMGYGFTPGAAATLIFPHKIGYDMARETLLTAREYSGVELQERGLSHPVLARAQVMPAALALAKVIAQRSRDQLIALKQQWANALHRQLQETFDLELAMHEQTFVHQADTLAQIRSSFASEAAPVVAPAVRSAMASASSSHADLRSIVDDLRGMLSHELRLSAQEIADDEPFVDLGLDSITGVTWIRRINDKYRTSIEAIKVYSYPTLAQLAQHVKQEAEKVGSLGVVLPVDTAATIATGAPAQPVPTSTIQPTVRSLTSWRTTRNAKTAMGGSSTTANEPIAVIGMAGQFPKANNLEAFWRNIAEGKDCIDEVPKHRWDLALYYQEGDAVPGKTNSRWMGVLDEYDLFDPAFFSISPREAKSMDPQQRLFLQACWHSIEDAGYDPKALSGSKCGVFVGCSTGDYHQLSRHEQLSGQGFTGAAPSILAARISYFLDLHGPSIAVDTACSSSLVAIASACDSLISRGSDVALAGGVNVMAGPAMQIMTAQVGMLSPAGRCFTFDRAANGIATGEGVGVVMLKRLADAQRDRDCIYGVVEGWGVNQDGKTNGITAPNADSQARLQQDVYQRFRIDPARIQLIEAHGTGTPLGDPIEVAGLKASFGAFTDKKDYCALGSVKSNIGHCLTAAGISGFIKLLLALRHRQLPPTIHFRELNEHISLNGTPFYVNTHLRDWERNGAEPRRAAINSFGFSGTNAHIVVSEPVALEEQIYPQSTPVIVPLSARTPEQLERKARDLLDFLVAPAAGCDLQRLAYTLQVGREAMNERLAFVASTLEELSQQLQAYVDRKQGGYRAQVSANKEALHALASDADFREMIQKWIGQQALPKLADLWVKGFALDWPSFHARTPQRMRLPLYPFAKERYWIEAAAAEPIVEVARSAVPLDLLTGYDDAAAGVVSAPLPSISLDQLQLQLQASLAEALFMKPAEVKVNRSFTELGLDSIIGVEWVKVVNKQYGIAIGATRIYDYPTVKEFAVFVHRTIGDSMLASASSPERAVAVAVAAAAASTAPGRSVVSVSRDELHHQLKASLAEALFIKPTDIDINRPFTELGLDSIIGVEWVKAINKRYGTTLTAIKIYDYPNIKSLAAFLLEAMASAAASSTGAASASESALIHTGSLAASASSQSAVRATSPSSIRFAPKYGKDFRELYFYSPHCEGDFEADGEIALTYAIDPENNVCLKEHVVFNEHLLPTDAYIELIYSAYRTYFASGDVVLKQIGIVNPLLGVKGRSSYVKVVFRRYQGDLQFFVRSGSSKQFENEKVHVQGFISPALDAPKPLEGCDFAVLQELSSGQIATNAGKYYAPLKKLQFGESAALGQIQVQSHEFNFLANPFALYGGLCTVINFGAWLANRAYGASDDQFLPHRIDKISLPGPFDGGDYFCHARVRKLQRDAAELDFQVVDGAGKPVAAVEGISLRRVAKRTIQQQVTAIQAAAPRKHGTGNHQEKVAIIGMACRYPLGETIEAFWNNLTAGKDCVTEVPAGRWDDYPNWYHPDPRHAHTSYSKWGGFLERIDTFDSLFFGISPAEAELIDPQQRLFLEECWKTIESAGYAPGALSHEACGVYVGCATSDYTRVLNGAGQDTAGAAFMGTSNAILAARIAYFLNLKGPALAVDTACSSSLVAVHLACESIRSGETQWALAGGINVLATPLGHILTSQVGMPSRDGRCASFDAAANGIVFSEGCGVLLLKALSRARADNDLILGVIQASGTNQDGKTNGITAPSANAQEQLLQQVYGKFGIDPKKISYVEAHGTATALGDPIEVNALTSVFQKHTAEKGYCALGSVKSNIGHTGFAAGVAGIIKVLLCMKHGKLVPSIHYSKPNPHIDFDSSPFFVNTEYRDWASDGPRLAAVSSFGFSGTNAHVVIEEDSAAIVKSAAPVGAKVLVPLSARAAEQLQQKASELLHFIRNSERPVDLARLAYTSQIGRDAMEQRVGFVVASLDELAGKLQDYLDGKAHIEGVHRAPATKDSDTLALFAADDGMRYVIDQWIANRNISKLVELWVRGLDVEWSQLYTGSQPLRMSLPTYPFAKQRCWVNSSAARVQSRGNLAVVQLHPLLHTNTSDLGQQNYSSTFSGDEFFLTDHCVNGQRVLPAVAYLEMARAAIDNALPGDHASTHLELRHIVFAQPIVVTAQKQVCVAVFAEEDERIAFEIYSPAGAGCDEVLHAQGYCTLVSEPRQITLDLSELKMQMSRGTLQGSALYPEFSNMGLDYGPAFQGITALHQGTNQLLAEVSLPQAARDGGGEFVLHPSLMDSALQGSITLTDGSPSLPFALESLRMLAPCTGEMLAWVRHSVGEHSCAANLLKVDIDLCDQEGKVCVQMRGFSSRPMPGATAFDEAHYRSIIDGVMTKRISAKEAAELG